MNPQQYPTPPIPPQPPKRKRRIWPWLLGAVVIIIVIAAASGGHDSTKSTTVIATSGVPVVKPATTPAPAHVGATLQIDTGDNATAAITLNSTGPGTPGPLSSGPVWALQVTIQSVTGNVDVNPLYWAVRTSDGHELSPDLAGVSDQIATTTVTPGQKVAGAVAFEVPDGQTVTTVLYKGPLGAQLGTWIVP